MPPPQFYEQYDFETIRVLFNKNVSITLTFEGGYSSNKAEENYISQEVLSSSSHPLPEIGAWKIPEFMNIERLRR